MSDWACPLRTSEEPLVTAYDCAMLDLDGVVYVGPHAVDGGARAPGAGPRPGMTLAFVTNNAARTPADVAAHLRELGVEARAEDVVTSAQAAAREVAERVPPGAKVLVVGGEGLDPGARGARPGAGDLGRRRPGGGRAGLPPAPSAGSCSPRARTRSARCLPWIASNLDLTVPTARGIAPGNGALVEAVATAVGREPDVVAGKPYRPLFDETVRRISSRRPLVVGDRLDTDIEGAVTCGADSLLVMTGVTDVEALCQATPDRRPVVRRVDDAAACSAGIGLPSAVDGRVGRLTAGRFMVDGRSPHERRAGRHHGRRHGRGSRRSSGCVLGVARRAEG